MSPDNMHTLKYWLLMCLCGIFLSYTGSAQNVRPNILFIAVDDLNDWIGVLSGHPQVKTPNMDRLAGQGVLFANAHAQAPLCNPSRTSLLTGLRPGTTGIYGLAPRLRQGERTRDVISLTQAFSQSGYHTIVVGKVFHDGIPEEERKMEADEWGPIGGFGPVPEEKIMKKKLDMVDHPLLDWGILPPEYDSLIWDHRIADWAVERIRKLEEKNDSRPFFLSVGFRRPHPPFLVTKRWFDLYPEEELILPPAPDGDRLDVPDFAWYLHWYLPEPRLSWLLKNEEWRNKVRAYLASISYVDHQIGKIVDAIENSSFNDHTIIVLWSDHGYHLGEKDITGKNSLWERATHIPLIFKGIGISSGEVCHEPVELLDIYPTLLELCGISLPIHLEGLSLVPQLKNVAEERLRPAITTSNPGNHSVRNREWRYIHYADGSEELYNLVRDPYEWSNLVNIGAYQNIKDELKAWLPEKDAPFAEGSAHRILEKRGNDWFWEGGKINFENLID